MNDNSNPAEALARAILNVVEREIRKRPCEPPVISAALGVAAAAITATAYPAAGPLGGIADGVMMACLGMGFTDALKAMREREGN